MRKELAGRKTPERINRAALQLFGKHGYRQVNMEMVAQKVGISRQALYKHFRTKEALFTSATESLHRSAFDAAEAASLAAIRSGKDLAGVLYAHLNARFSEFMVHLEDTPFADELTEESAHLAGRIAAEYAQRLEASVARIIRSDVLGGHMRLARDLTPDELAYLVVAAARGLKEARPAPKLKMFRERLQRMLGLIVAGAVTKRLSAAKPLD